MESFAEGITHEQFHNFEKSSLLCFHMDIDGIEPTKEGDLDGWWLPLRHNILSWRGINLQEPMSKNMVTFGHASMTVSDDNKFLTVVYKGNQLFRTDLKGIDFTNMTLYIAPPHNMSDTRPIPPQLP